MQIIRTPLHVTRGIGDGAHDIGALRFGHRGENIHALIDDVGRTE